MLVTSPPHRPASARAAGPCSSSCAWVCWLLVAAGSGCDTDITPKALPAARLVPFELSAVSPSDGALDVAPDTVVEITFSNSLSRDELGADLSRVELFVEIRRAADGAPVPGAWRLESFDRRLVFTPADDLETPGVVHEIIISPALLDAENQALGAAAPAAPLTFTTVADTTPPAFAGLQALEGVCSALLATWPAAVDDFTPAERIVYRISVIPRPPAFPADPLEVTGTTRILLSRLVEGTLYTVGVTAIDGTGNESAPTPPLQATAALSDSEPPAFDGALDMARDLASFSATTLRLRWSAATDNCDPTSVRYRVYLRLCQAADPVCEEVITIADCSDFVVACGVPPGDCDDIELRCAFSAEGCAVAVSRCEVDPAEVISSPTRIVTTEPGATELLVEGLVPDRRYAAIVRAVDTADNEDDNMRLVEASTRTSFDLDVSSIFATAGCTAAGCHDPQTRSGCLDLGSYEGLVIEGGCTADPPTIEPGDPEGSTLFRRIVSASNAVRMPPCFASKLPLCPRQIGVVRRWIEQGAFEN